MDAQMRMALLAMGHAPELIERIARFDIFDRQTWSADWFQGHEIIVGVSVETVPVDGGGMLLHYGADVPSECLRKVWYEIDGSEDIENFNLSFTLVMRKRFDSAFEVVEPRMITSWEAAWTDPKGDTP